MIRSAIGRPRPNVPRIVSANAESIFDAGGELRTNMTLFPLSPTSLMDQRSNNASGPNRDAFRM
jgi:hypothetical protein